MNDVMNISETPSPAELSVTNGEVIISEEAAPKRRKAASKTATPKTTRAKKETKDAAPKTTRAKTTRTKKDAAPTNENAVADADTDSQPALQFTGDEERGTSEKYSEQNGASARIREEMPRHQLASEGAPSQNERSVENVETSASDDRNARQNEDGSAQNDNAQNESAQSENSSGESVQSDNIRSDNRNENRGEGRALRSRGRDNRNEAPRENTRHDSRSNESRGSDNRGGNARSDNRGNDTRNNNARNDTRGNRGESRGTRGDTRGMDRYEREAQRARPDYDLIALESKTLDELNALAAEMGVDASDVEQNELVTRLLEAQAAAQGFTYKSGVLEILPDSRGFLRVNGYLPGDGDVYVSSSQIKRFNLKTGDMVAGQARSPKDAERHYGLLRVESINGELPDNMKTRKDFEKLTPIFPEEKWTLETDQNNITSRVIELVSPIGKGQRGLIVAPPKAGKTTLIKSIANSISRNHPEAILIVLLIDERPEEVTDISRSVRGEVVASTFDETAENHMRVAEMVMERAKRLAEQKNDVVILLDSITRLSRASNLVVPTSGRTMSGGLDPAAMHKPKKMFGAARNIEEGGSLTILATALVDTGSRMDEYIFEEFKGTGNLDLVLDRSLFDQRIFPAIDIKRSGTRRDDLLMSKEDLATVYHLRRTLANLDNDKAINLLIDRLRNTKTNADFMQIVSKSAKQGQIQNP